MAAVVPPLEERLGYRFRDKTLLREAMTHASTNEANNERLEFLGDAVLDLVVSGHLFAQFPVDREGPLTERKSQLVARRTLEDVGAQLGLHQDLRVGGGLERRDSMPRSLLGNALEAVLGAIWLDAPLETRFDICQKCVQAWFGKRLADAPRPKQGKHLTEPLGSKQLLQDYAQGKQVPLPRYLVTDEFVHPQTRAFRVEVELQGKRYPGAWGSTKRQAERLAAVEALRELEAKSRP